MSKIILPILWIVIAVFFVIFSAQSYGKLEARVDMQDADVAALQRKCDQLQAQINNQMKMDDEVIKYEQINNKLLVNLHTRKHHHG